MRKRVLVAVGVLLGLRQISRLLRLLRYSFRGKIVVITGGSRGLGLVLARQFCAERAKVVLLARDAEELRRAQRDLGGRGGEAITMKCDLTDAAQLQFTVDQIVQRFGRVDVLINNAGIILMGPLHHMQPEDFERAMQLHFWAPFALTMQLMSHMRGRGEARIVNISSIGGKIAVPHLAAYCASKFALTGFSDAVRAELARDRIYVTTVAPGLMRTGSHVNARFKGKHDAEFGWFAAASSMPLITMKAERAAAKIIAACRRGQPSLILTFAARGAIVGNALFPNLTGYAMRLANRFLPNRTNERGNESQLGWDSPLRAAAPEWLTRLSERATARNNEQRPQVEPS
jgi:NAD(P)-dependent dehydrogenase (short-subunit alcohol dehydrogenase family)